MKRGKKAQVWIETVLYTVIGLVILGLVLAFAQPKIAEIKDRTVIEQTLETLNQLDNQIMEVKINGPGNIRTPELKITRGELLIDGVNDQIIFKIKDSRVIYSEPGKKIKFGSIEILSETSVENAKRADISLILDYSPKNINLKYGGAEESKTFQPVSTFYKISIENLGADDNLITEINMKEIS